MGYCRDAIRIKQILWNFTWNQWASFTVADLFWWLKQSITKEGSGKKTYTVWPIKCHTLERFYIKDCLKNLMWNGPNLYGSRFGNGGILPSWSLPNKRYTYRGLRTNLGKILSIWPFENTTTVLLDNLKWQSKNFIKVKMFLMPPLLSKISILDLSNQVLEGSIICTVVKSWVFWKVLRILLCKGVWGKFQIIILAVHVPNKIV